MDSNHDKVIQSQSRARNDAQARATKSKLRERFNTGSASYCHCARLQFIAMLSVESDYSNDYTTFERKERRPLLGEARLQNTSDVTRGQVFVDNHYSVSLAHAKRREQFALATSRQAGGGEQGSRDSQSARHAGLGRCAQGVQKQDERRKRSK